MAVIPFALPGCLATGGSGSTATPVQLRVMQTRKFEKPPREVVDAIKTNCEDLGGTASVYAPMNTADQSTTGNIKGKQQEVVNKDLSSNGQGMCQLGNQLPQTSAASFIPYVGGFIAMANLNEAMKNASRMSYEIKTNPKMTETTVRMRIYTMQQEQMTDPKIYSEYFKKIGDAIFVQAIEINPATQE